MAIRVDFAWRNEPVFLFLEFGSGRSDMVGSAAALFPIVAESLMARSVADAIIRLGHGSIVDQRLVAGLRVQETDLARVEFRIARIMPKYPDVNRAASILLGLNFIAAFGSAHLELGETTGNIVIG